MSIFNLKKEILRAFQVRGELTFSDLKVELWKRGVITGSDDGSFENVLLDLIKNNEIGMETASESFQNGYNDGIELKVQKYFTLRYLAGYKIGLSTLERQFKSGILSGEKLENAKKFFG